MGSCAPMTLTLAISRKTVDPTRTADRVMEPRSHGGMDGLPDTIPISIDHSSLNKACRRGNNGNNRNNILLHEYTKNVSRQIVNESSFFCKMQRNHEIIGSFSANSKINTHGYRKDSLYQCKNPRWELQPQFIEGHCNMHT